MSNIVYPLKQILEIKERRVEEAEKVLKEKRDLLAKEEEKLRQTEAARDKVLHHQQDKLKQLRDELDHTTTSPKIQQMKAYLKVVEEKLQVEEKKVKNQKEQVNIAQKNVDEAKLDLDRKRLEVEKFTSHQKDWEKEMRKELEIIEGREQDELGNTIFLGKIQMRRNSKS